MASNVVGGQPPTQAVEEQLLSVADFTLVVGGMKLRIGDLRLAKGGIYALYGDSASHAAELLYVLGGVREPLEHSLPAPEGRVQRVSVALDDSMLGRVQLDGRPIFELPCDERARRIGFIFQNPEWAILAGTVLEEFWFAFAAAGLHCPDPIVLHQYGLIHMDKRQTETLSGGEMHRLSCAVALGTPRDLIVADFSRSNLDKPFQREVSEWIRTRTATGSTAIVHGLRPDEMPEHAIPLVSKVGELEFGQPNRAEFPTLSAERDTLTSILAPRKHGKQPVFEATRLRARHSRASVSGRLAAGEILRVTGANGIGKSAFLRVVAQREMPVGGTLTLAEGTRAVLSVQHPEHCFFAATVEAELPDRALLRLCGLDESSWRKHPRVLPLAQQKLLAIAAALTLSANLVLLDEPTCGMDHAAKRIFVSLLNAFPELAVIIVTHDDALEGIGIEFELGGRQ